MTLSREAIDLIESLAERITAAIENYDDGKYGDFTGYMAIGELRRDIMHGQICPCSKCQKFEVVSCSDKCSAIRKLLPDELERLENSMAHSEQSLYYCGYCRYGQNEWHTDQMLFDTVNEIAVTPCCHTEATEALKCYCPEDQCEADDDSVARQDRYSYISAQTGR